MAAEASPRPLPKTRQFFWRGLGVLLPSVLTIWILIAAYQFVQHRIAEPINAGVREAILALTSYPAVAEDERPEPGNLLGPKELRQWRSAGKPEAWIAREARREKLEDIWQNYAFPLDLIGLLVAIVLIYGVGLVVASFLGARVVARGEELLRKVPLIRGVYPSVKQVTDFLVGADQEAMNFNRVVAVEYPRRGVWSLGLVTGETMRAVQAKMNQTALTVFIPSSPTPFTGYVITVPAEEAVDLGISIEDALRFTVSGGVIIPPSQRITTDSARAETEETPRSAEA